MYETLKVERQDGLVWLTLNRPERLNALSRALVRELGDFLAGIAEDREARVVILRGAGRAFCAGLDLKEAAEAGGALGDSVASGMSSQRDFSQVVVRMRRAPQPIIAAVHGAASGGGFSLALAADVRIAAESARMNAAFIRIGLTGCDMGSSYLLPRMVGASVAAELLLTGNFVDAGRAEKLGLVSKVVPDAELDSAARALASDMLRNSPLGLRLTKEGLNANLDAAGLEQALVIEDRNQILCTLTDDFREGMKAFLEKRPARYNDR
jgi:enoyl-CoA hydratase/carnithine racemase